MQMSAKHIFPFATKSNQVKGECINKHKESLLQKLSYRSCQLLVFLIVRLRKDRKLVFCKEFLWFYSYLAKTNNPRIVSMNIKHV